MSSGDTEIFYMLVCRDCGDPSRPLPIPFPSAEERGKWAAAHTKGTGHENWFVLDQEVPAQVRGSSGEDQPIEPKPGIDHNE